MNLKTILIILLMISSGFLFYYAEEEKSGEIIYARVAKVIDGDTIELENNEKIRLLGINTPEKNQAYYEEAKDFLIKRIGNKTVKIETKGKDRYGRILGHIFFENSNINKEILEEGLATLYYYEEDSYYRQLRNSEEKAREEEKGLWKKSSNENCIHLIQLKYGEEGKRCTNKEILEIKNSCDFDIEVTLKDDATHIYVEVFKANEVFKKSFSCIWNDAGDSLYIWDNEGLMLFWRY